MCMVTDSTKSVVIQFIIGQNNNVAIATVFLHVNKY